MAFRTDPSPQTALQTVSSLSVQSGDDGSLLDSPPPYYDHGLRPHLSDGASAGPIARLPAELLQLVFTLAASPGSEDPDLADLRRSQPTVFACASVCSTWRTAALGTYHLWAHVLDFQRMRIPSLRLFIERSHPALFNVGHRSAPLALPAATGGSMGPALHARQRVRGCIALLYAFRDRIRELHVEWGLYPGVVDEVNVEFCKLEGMSRLEAVTWGGFGPVDWQAYQKVLLNERRSEAAPIGAELYPKTASPPAGLRRFDAERSFLRFNVGPPSNLLVNLTELVLDRPTFMYEEQWAMRVGDLKAILRATPRLRFLALQNVLREGEEVACIPPLVELPDLVLVSIGGQTNNVLQAAFAFFASVIVASAKCSLLVTPIYRGLRWENAQIWRERVGEMFSRSSTSDMALYVCADEEDLCTASTVPNVEHQLDWRRRGGENVAAYLDTLEAPVLAFSFKNGVGAARPPLPYLSSLLPRVKTLHMSVTIPDIPSNRGHGHYLEEMVRSYVEAFSTHQGSDSSLGLTTVILYESAVELFLRVLNDQHQLVDLLLHEPYLPALRSLRLCGCDFVRVENALFPLLVELVGGRANTGCGLEVVTFYQSTLPEKEVLDALSEQHGCAFVVEELDGFDCGRYMAYCQRNVEGYWEKRTNNMDYMLTRT